MPNVRWVRAVAGTVAYVAALAGTADAVIAGPPAVPGAGLRAFGGCAAFTAVARNLAARDADRMVVVGARLVALTESAAVLLDPQGLRPLASARLTPLNTA